MFDPEDYVNTYEPTKPGEDDYDGKEMNSIERDKYKKDLGSAKHDIIIKGLFSNQSIDSFFNTNNKEKVENIIKLENFKSNFNKSIDLYGVDNISRISLIGLGSKKKFTSDKLRSIASNITRKFELRSGKQ